MALYDRLSVASTEFITGKTHHTSQVADQDGKHMLTSCCEPTLLEMQLQSVCVLHILLAFSPASPLTYPAIFLST